VELSHSPRNRHHELFVGIFKDTMTRNPATSLERYAALWGISENQINQVHSVPWKELVQINMRHDFIMADPSFSRDAAVALHNLAFQANVTTAGMRDIMAWVKQQARVEYPNWKEHVSSQTIPKNFESQITVFFQNMRHLMASGTLYQPNENEFWPWFTATLEHTATP